MKTFIFIFTILLCLPSLYGQDTIIIKYSNVNTVRVDTIIPKSIAESEVIVGTMIMSMTNNQQGLKNVGLSLAKVFKKEYDCDEVPSSGKTRITDVEESSDSLKITFEHLTICCKSFLCDAREINGDTLDLIIHDYGGHCACSCKYKLVFTFYKFGMEEGYEKLRYIIINGNRKTQRRIK